MKVVTEGLTGEYLVKGCDVACLLILALQTIAKLEITHLLQSDFLFPSFRIGEDGRYFPGKEEGMF
jgi:hypothetical protein